MADNTPFFSVIIPVLNEQRYIPILLSCLAKQQYKEFEVLVVDGGSTDKTVDVMKSYFHSLPRFTIIQHSAANVGAQRNLGAQKAIGEYLIFFDADVQIPRNFLSKVKQAIDATGAQLLSTWLRPDTDIPGDQAMVAVTNIAMEAASIIDMPFCGGFNIIIQKHVFDIIHGFNTKLAMNEDHDLVQRAAKSGSPMHLLRSPRLIMSLRRFRTYGYFAIIKLYAQTTLYVFLKKPVTQALVDYPMGGHLYTTYIRHKEKVSLPALERTLRKAVKPYLTNNEYLETVSHYTKKVRKTASSSISELKKFLIEE